MKTFNTHIEAARYLLEKPEEHKVYTEYGPSKINFNANMFGTISDLDGERNVLEDYSPPFYAVEPEKTNRELVRELLVTHCFNWEDILTTILEIMDEKMKKALAK